MNVKDIMTTDPVCCNAETPLSDVARMMVERDCGEIPVVQHGTVKRPIGVITDRDITVRTVAAGRNPLELTAKDCMTQPVITVAPDDTLDACCAAMEEHQIRRVPVVDAKGSCCGMVSQADIARAASPQDTAEVVREVSEPSGGAARSLLL